VSRARRPVAAALRGFWSRQAARAARRRALAQEYLSEDQPRGRQGRRRVVPIPEYPRTYEARLEPKNIE